MAKHYRAVPLDEEQTHSSSEAARHEKGGLQLRTNNDDFENDVRTKVLDFAFENWSWIGHLVLLTSSITMFMLSFCSRTAKPSDLQVTRQFSSYCMPGTILSLSLMPTLGTELTMPSSRGSHR